MNKSIRVLTLFLLFPSSREGFCRLVMVLGADVLMEAASVDPWGFINGPQAASDWLTGASDDT